jgi:hypothetical protein
MSGDLFWRLPPPVHPVIRPGLRAQRVFSEKEILVNAIVTALQKLNICVWDYLSPEVKEEKEPAR